MDAEDSSLPQATGKIRVRAGHGGRNRGKPYARKSKATKKEDRDDNNEQGFLEKVSSYIVPNWISSWFTGNKKETCEQELSSGEDSSCDESEPQKVVKVTQFQVTGNNINHKHALKNLTSTPMVRNPAPFSILKSDILDPQEGSSTDTKEQPVILDGRSLLSVKDDLEITRKPDEGESEINTSAPIRFSLGVASKQTPQRLAVRNKPSFKVSSFVSSSTFIPSGSSSSSAFYPGQTSFGGASSIQQRSIKRQRVSPVAANVLTKKANVKPKSLPNARMGAVTSETARKILGALERMSSPVREASKLPSSPSSVLFNPMKRRSDFTLSQSSARASPKPNQPPTQSIFAPSMFKIRKTTKSDGANMFANKFTSGEARPGVSVSTFKSRGLPTSFSPENDNRSSGKMKRQRQTAHYASAAPDKEEEPVNKLPAIKESVPLPVKSLPKFDFLSNQKAKQPDTRNITETKSSENVINEHVKSSSSLFKFAQPEKITKSHRQLPSEPVKSTFQFSAPVTKDKKDENQSQKEATSKQPSFSVSPAKSEKAATTGSGESSDGGLLKELANPSKTKDTKINLFAEKFKPAPGSWECDTCMVRNKEESGTCVACTANKPSTNSGTVPLPAPVITDNKAASSDVFAKFKPSANSWDCEVCMVNNKPEANACVCCTTPKPGAAAPPTGSASTMSSNTAAKITFGVAADTAKPNSVTFGSNGGFKFGSGSSVKFGSSASEGQNASDNKSVAFGSTTKGISFGISENKEAKTNDTQNKEIIDSPSDKETNINSKEFCFGSGSKSIMFGNEPSKNNAFKTMLNKSLGSKTEENNNKLSQEVIPSSTESKMPIIEKKSESFPTIAEAAQAGLLKVPQIQEREISLSMNKESSQTHEAPKFSFGAMSNGPVSSTFGKSATSLSSSEPIVSSATVAPKSEVPSFSFGKVTKSEPSKSFSFGLGSGSGSAAGQASKGFNFSSPSSTVQQPVQSGGFSFEKASGISEKPKEVGENTAKPPLIPSGSSDAPSSINLFGNSSINKESVDAKKPFSFTSDASKVSFGASQVQQKPPESLFKFSNNQDATKPAGNDVSTSLFQKDNHMNANPVKPEFSSLFKTPDSNAQSTGNLFAAPSTNVSAAPSSGFSFGNNLNSNPAAGGLFNKPAVPNPVADNTTAGTGFSFGFSNATSGSNSSAKPFIFAPVLNQDSAASGGFQFGAKAFETGANAFGSGSPNPNQAPVIQSPASSFTNSVPAAGGFNFSSNTNNTSTPVFSSGAPAASHRPIKKAVRRRK